MTHTLHAAHGDFDRLLSTAQLPALPQSAVALIELSKNTENGPAEFAVPIEADPGLTSQVLKFVNSSYFGFSREIANVKLAITLVGIRTIKNFALWSAVFSIIPNPKCGPFDLRALWQDSLRRALFARRLGKRLGIRDAEDLCAAGLLQDVAVPVLAKVLPREYAELLTARDDGRRRLSDLELDRFGWHHGQAGAYLTTRWNFPQEFAELIEKHVSLDAALAAGERAEVLAVALSALLPAAGDGQWHEAARFEAAYQQLPLVEQVALADLLAQVDQDFEEFAPIIRVASGTAGLAARYESATQAAH